MTWEDINALLEDGYEVNDDRLPYLENTPINTGKTNQLVYKRYGNLMAYTIGGNHTVD